MSNFFKFMILGTALLMIRSLSADIGEITVQSGPASALTKEAVRDPSTLRFNSKPRVTILVVNPSGHRTGYDLRKNVTVQDIPDSECEVDFEPNPYTGQEHWEAYERMTIAPAPVGMYLIHVHGLQDGPFEINVSALSREGSSQPSKQVEGLISAGENKTFRVAFDPTGNNQLAVVEQPSDPKVKN